MTRDESPFSQGVPTLDQMISQSLVHLKVCTRDQIQKVWKNFSLNPSSRGEKTFPQHLLDRKLLTPDLFKKIQALLKRGYYHCARCSQVFPHRSSGSLPQRDCPRCQLPMDSYQWPLNPLEKSSRDKTPDTNSQLLETHQSSTPSQIEPDQSPPFEILDTLGQGGHGQVYRARDPFTGRTVALKVLREKVQDNFKIKERFKRELKITSHLEHPSIMPVYYCGYLQEGSLYLAMKEIRGGTLRELMKEKKGEPGPGLGDLMEIFLKICEAVEFAHSKGVIHRDLKPSNVAVGDFGEVMVLDWGIAKAAGMEEASLALDQGEEEEVIEVNGHTLTRGGMLGTPGFMAPEQARGDKITPATDIHALGAILYRILTGEIPFPGPVSQRLVQLLTAPPPPPHSARPHLKIPRELSAIAHKCLSHNPQDRYQSVAELRQDILRYKEGFSVTAYSDDFWTAGLKWIRRNKALTLAMVLMVMAVFATLGAIKYFASQAREDRFQENFQAAQKMLGEKNFTRADELKERYPHSFALKRQERAHVRKMRQASLEVLFKVRKKLEKAWSLKKGHQEVKKKLFDVEKEIGKLALLGKNYLLAERAFAKCQAYDPTRGKPLVDLVELKKREVARAYKKRLQEIMEKLALKPPQEGMYDEYITEITKMGIPEVVQVLVTYLSSPHFWQRKTAIEALGKIGGGHTRYQGKDVVQWLMDHLRELSVEENREEAEALIWALGRLRDTRAYQLVRKKRGEAETNSIFFKETELPLGWIPPPSLDKENKKAGDWFELAQSELNLKSYPKALEYISQAIALEPKKAKYYNLRGVVYKKMNKNQPALADFRKAIALEPQEYQPYLNRAFLLVEMKKYDQAFKSAKAVLDFDPGCTTAYFCLGFIKVHMKKYEEALQYYNKVEKMDPQHINLYHNRGECYKKMGHFQKAIKDYNKAIELNPRDAPAYYNRATIYAYFKRYTRAFNDLDAAIGLRPRMALYYTARGTLSLSLNKFKGALRDFNESLRLKPDQYKVICQRGVTYLNTGEYEKALEDFNRCIKSNSQDAYCYLDRAFVLRKLGKYDGAERDYRTFVKLKPNSAKAAQIRMMLKDYEENYKGKMKNKQKK